MSEAYRSVGQNFMYNTSLEPKPFPIVREDVRSRPEPPEQELPIRLRANTTVGDGSRPAYFRGTVRSYEHLVDWASQRADFNRSKDFFRYQDEHGDVLVQDESDFREAIIALRTMREAGQFLSREQPSPPLFVEKESARQPSQSPQPPSPRSMDRLEMWVVKNSHASNYLYRHSESIREIADFINETSPSSIERLRGFVEFRGADVLGTNLLIPTEPPVSNLGDTGLSPVHEEKSPIVTFGRFGDYEERSQSASASPLMTVTSEAGVTKSLESLSLDVNGDGELVFHVWAARDESGAKYRFRVGSFESHFGSRETVDVTLFPLLCLGMIPASMRHVFARASVNVNVKDLCLFVEQVSERELDRDVFGLGVVAGYGARDDLVGQEERRSSPGVAAGTTMSSASSRGMSPRQQQQPTQQRQSSLAPENVDSDNTPFARRLVSASSQSSVFPPTLGKLPSSGNVFGDEPAYKS